MFFGLEGSFNTIILIKLLISLGLGFMIGLEREIRKKPVGIRTCTVISVISCLLTIISIEAANKYSVEAIMPMDPMRLPAQIVSGIGFIGAGVILRRNNDIVSGLTTAAIVWGVCGIGISIGSGFIIEALIAVLFILIGVEIVPYFLKKLGLFKMNANLYIIRITTNPDIDLNQMLFKIKQGNIKIHELIIDDRKEQIHIQLKAYIKGNTIENIYQKLRKIPEIETIRLE